eukprot:1161281-Pelagomonas_calceolata.AAC.3
MQGACKKRAIWFNSTVYKITSPVYDICDSDDIQDEKHVLFRCSNPQLGTIKGLLPEPNKTSILVGEGGGREGERKKEKEREREREREQWGSVRLSSAEKVHKDGFRTEQALQHTSTFALPSAIPGLPVAEP